MIQRVIDCGFMRDKRQKKEEQAFKISIDIQPVEIGDSHKLKNAPSELAARGRVDSILGISAVVVVAVRLLDESALLNPSSIE